MKGIVNCGEVHDFHLPALQSLRFSCGEPSIGGCLGNELSSCQENWKLS